MLLENLDRAIQVRPGEDPQQVLNQAKEQLRRTYRILSGRGGTWVGSGVRVEPDDTIDEKGE